MKNKRNTVGRNGRGSVLLIAGLLFSSALLRIGVGAGQAVATESPFEPARDTPEVARSDETSELDLSRYGEMLAAFQTREKALLKKEQELKVHERTLEVASEEIERRLVALEDAENSLREMLAVASTAAEEDVSTLVAVYENMKPKDAAKLFEEMDPPFAAGFLGRMKPASAAGILAGLSPEAAYAVSVILAGRNAEVPQE